MSAQCLSGPLTTRKSLWISESLCFGHISTSISPCMTNLGRMSSWTWRTSTYLGHSQLAKSYEWMSHYPLVISAPSYPRAWPIWENICLMLSKYMGHSPLADSYEWMSHSPLVISALAYPHAWPIWDNVCPMLKHQRSSLAKSSWLILCIILLIQISMATMGGYLQSAHLWISIRASFLPSIPCLVWSLARIFWSYTVTWLATLVVTYYVSIVLSATEACFQLIP
jgi:hypothetical protein